MDASQLLTQRARLTPNSPALVDLTAVDSPPQRYSYAELNQRVCQTAAWLTQAGVEYGDRVSILGHNSVVYADLFFAAGKIGAVFTPLNWRLTAGELVWIIGNCSPKVLIVEPEFEPLLAEMRDQIAGVQLVTRGRYEASLSACSSDEPARPAELNGESTHAILYTSGTTGRPKGALIPQRQVLWNAIATTASWGLTAADCAPILTPMFHAGGLFVFLTPLIYAGGKVVIAKEFDLKQSLEIIKNERCTTVLGVPTIYQMWLDSGLLEQADLSSMRFFMSGGAPCPVPLIHRWRQTTGIPLRQGYGMSEVGVNCFSMTDEDSSERAGSVGKPIMHLNVQIVDGTGAVVPPGETGELSFSGPQICSGYLNNPKATAETIRDGWFYTGDMAKKDADGYVTIVGRFKDMLISGGENVYAAEVEAAFMAHPAVQECALIGKPDHKWGEVGLLFVVLEKGQTADSEQLLDFSRQQLARFKVPKEVLFLDQLPHSPYGKVEKLKLKELYI